MPPEGMSAKRAAGPRPAMGISSPASKKARAAPPPPTGMAENVAIDCVASAVGPIRTPVASAADGEIVLERLRKEIVEGLGFALARDGGRRRRRRARARGGEFYMTGGGAIRIAGGGAGAGAGGGAPPGADLKAHLVAGIGQCTRALEAAAGGRGPPPSLVLLARDVRPPTVLAHLPPLCQRAGSPTYVLPGRASVDLGRVLGVRSVAALAFLPSGPGPGPGPDDGGASSASAGRKIDSFVKFALSRMSGRA